MVSVATRTPETNDLRSAKHDSKNSICSHTVSTEEETVHRSTDRRRPNRKPKTRGGTRRSPGVEGSVHKPGSKVRSKSGYILTPGEAPSTYTHLHVRREKIENVGLVFWPIGDRSFRVSGWPPGGLENHRPPVWMGFKLPPGRPDHRNERCPIGQKTLHQNSKFSGGPEGSLARFLDATTLP